MSTSTCYDSAKVQQVGKKIAMELAKEGLCYEDALWALDHARMLIGRFKPDPEGLIEPPKGTRQCGI